MAEMSYEEHGETVLRLFGLSLRRGVANIPYPTES